MLTLSVPGFGELRLEHLVSDFNGTLAQDGRLLSGIRGVIAGEALELLTHPTRLVATLRD